MNPLQNPPQNTPLNSGQQPSPIMPPAQSEPVSTPLPQQPLGSQGIPTGQVPGGGQLATPEQKAELQRMLDETKNKYAELQTAKFSSVNEKEVARVETLKDIFIKMQEAGVDLNDPSSVSSFLDRLRAANPSMADQFESTLEDLLSEDMPVEGQQAGINPPSFDSATPVQGAPNGAIPPTPNINETIPKDIRGPLQG